MEDDGPWPYPDEVGMPLGAAGGVGRRTGAGLVTGAGLITGAGLATGVGLITGAFTTFTIRLPVDAFRVDALALPALALLRMARALGLDAADLAADLREAFLAAAFRTGFLARALAERLVREVVFFLREDVFAIFTLPVFDPTCPSERVDRIIA